MSLWPLRKTEKKDRVVILVDYENVSKEASLEGKIIDFQVITKKCLEIGIIDFAFVFMPEYMMSYNLPQAIHDNGFYVIACPSAYRNGNQVKEKDRVDTIMTELGNKFLERSDITHLVIVSHDGDFVRLANSAKQKGKKVVVIANSRISEILKQVADISIPLPVCLKQ